MYLYLDAIIDSFCTLGTSTLETMGGVYQGLGGGVG